jgi:Tol biopolymer transport system component
MTRYTLARGSAIFPVPNRPVPGGRIRRFLIGLCGIAGAACAGSTGTPAAPGATTPAGTTPPSQTYIQPEPGERHLRNIRQLTFSGNNAESYFSKSGRQLIFQRQEKVDSACDQEYIMNIDGSGMRRISNGLGRTTCGYFYANDTRVLYSSTFKSSPECPPVPDRSHGYVWPLSPLEIYTSKPDGSDLRQLTSDGSYNAEATLSPDGGRIIFTSTRDGDLELYTMNVDGSDVRRITHRVGYDGGAFFSHDGRMIVWRAGYPVSAADSADYLGLLKQRLVRPAHVELWVANADGSNPRQITNLGGANFAPYFLPDDKRIIFSSNYREPRSGKFDLYLINVDGSGLEQVTTHPDFDGFPMFSPDGRKLVWASNRHGHVTGETDLFIADWVE